MTSHVFYEIGSLLSKSWSTISIANNADVNDDNLPFSEMVLKFAEKVHVHVYTSFGFLMDTSTILHSLSAGHSYCC